MPCVLRIADDGQLVSGTFLEGWASTWHVPGLVSENVTQPVLLATLADGDVVVSHDGGYNLPSPASGMEAFYAVPDHLSRLSADLTQRRWLVSWHSPLIGDPTAVTRHLHASMHFTMGGGTPAVDWRHGFLGNPRTLGLAVDGRRQVVAVGWSPTRTAGEPWWSPFVVRFDGDGNEVGRWFAPDPFDGDDERLHGVVSDAAVFAVAAHGDDGLVLSLGGDGGNNVNRRDPRNWRQKLDKKWQGRFGPMSGRHLFWGGLAHLDGEGRLTAARYLGRPQRDTRRRKPRVLMQDCWAEAVAVLADGRVAAIGRFRGTLDTVGQPWPGSDPVAHYGSFLGIYSVAMEPRYVTALDPLRATALAAGGGRLFVAGHRGSGHGARAVVVAVAP